MEWGLFLTIVVQFIVLMFLAVLATAVWSSIKRIRDREL